LTEKGEKLGKIEQVPRVGRPGRRLLARKGKVRK